MCLCPLGFFLYDVVQSSWCSVDSQRVHRVRCTCVLLALMLLIPRRVKFWYLLGKDLTPRASFRDRQRWSDKWFTLGRTTEHSA